MQQEGQRLPAEYQELQANRAAPSDPQISEWLRVAEVKPTHLKELDQEKEEYIALQSEYVKGLKAKATASATPVFCHVSPINRGRPGIVCSARSTSWGGCRTWGSFLTGRPLTDPRSSVLWVPQQRIGAMPRAHLHNQWGWQPGCDIAMTGHHYDWSQFMAQDMANGYHAQPQTVGGLVLMIQQPALPATTPVAQSSKWCTLS